MDSYLNGNIPRNKQPLLPNGTKAKWSENSYSGCKRFQTSFGTSLSLKLALA